MLVCCQSDDSEQHGTPANFSLVQLDEERLRKLSHLLDDE
jgi:hypothetical protein